jgi:hypothetical protein
MNYISKFFTNPTKSVDEKLLDNLTSNFVNFWTSRDDAKFLLGKKRNNVLVADIPYPEKVEVNSFCQYNAEGISSRLKDLGLSNIHLQYEAREDACYIATICYLDGQPATVINSRFNFWKQEYFK